MDTELTDRPPTGLYCAKVVGMRTGTERHIAVERYGANIDAPDAYYQAAHVRVIGVSVVVLNVAGEPIAEYEYDDRPHRKANGAIVGTVDGAPLVVADGCGCKNKPFTVTPKGAV